MPARARRTCIHMGVSAEGSNPETERSTNRSHAEGSAIDAGWASSVKVGGSTSAGSRQGTPKAVAVSRAMPRIDRAYPRSGVISSSMTSSRSPSSSTTSAPRWVSAGRIRMPLWSSPMPSSRAEQIMPSDTWP